jgi:hypothetical protein
MVRMEDIMPVATQQGCCISEKKRAFVEKK